MANELFFPFFFYVIGNLCRSRSRSRTPPSSVSYDLQSYKLYGPEVANMINSSI